MRVTNSYTMTEKLWEESFSRYAHRRQWSLYAVILTSFFLIAVASLAMFFISLVNDKLDLRGTILFVGAFIVALFILAIFLQAFFTKTYLCWPLIRSSYIASGMRELGAENKHPYEVDVEIVITDDKITYEQKGISVNHHIAIRWIYESEHFLILGLPGKGNSYNYIPLKKDAFSDNTTTDLMEKYFQAIDVEFKDYDKPGHALEKLEDYTLPTKTEGEMS